MDKPEIIVNLWYVFDDEGYIFGLRGRTYVGEGTDQQKLTFLQKYATIDYILAYPFLIPSRLYVKGQKLSHKSVLDMVGSADFFAEVFEGLNQQLPVPRLLTIPDQPLICVTPLTVNDRGQIIPVIKGEEHY